MILKNAKSGTDTHTHTNTHTQTDGHSNLENESAWSAISVKILMLPGLQLKTNIPLKKNCIKRFLSCPQGQTRIPPTKAHLKQN